MTTVKKTKVYSFYNHQTSRMDSMKVDYSLIYEDNKLIDVKNEYGYSVEKKSEVWEEFNKQFNHL